MTEELNTLREQLIVAIKTIDGLLIKKDKGIYNTVDEVLDMVCDYYEITRGELISRRRQGEWVRRRTIAMQLLRELVPNLTLWGAAQAVGYSTHSNVYHHLSGLKDILKGEIYDLYDVKKDYEAIKKRLEA
jgi:chromosomal replication initiation ATPase DnaA